MKNLYTLAAPMSGKQEKLNGKVFFLKRRTAFPNDFETVQMIDPSTNQIIWQTSAIKEIVKNEDVITIISQNTIYTFIDVSSILPSGKAFVPDDSIMPLEIVDNSVKE